MAISSSRSVSQDEGVLLALEPAPADRLAGNSSGADARDHAAAVAPRAGHELQPPSRRRVPSTARRPASGVMPCRSTACGVMPAPSRTLASAAVFAAASQPSTSSDASASAMPPRLHLRQRRVERLPLFHRGQDEVRRAVDDAAEADHVDGRQRLPHEVEDRNAVHHRAFEEEPAIGARGRARERAVGERDRALVRGDDVRAAGERGADVADRRLAARDVQRRRLDDDEAP